jgi:O-antigen/teichoic acid export membrane protein
MLALVLLWWHATNATVLLSGDRIGIVAALSTVTAGFNVAVNSVAIPRYGAAGAAAVTAASELLSLVIFTPLVCRRLEIPPKIYIRNLLMPRLSSDDLDLLLDRAEDTPDPSGAQ